MDYELAFGKKHAKKTKSKLNKKMLDSMTLKKLKVLAKKHKVSYHKKGTKVDVKKSTLLKRLKKSRSVKKILESALKMKKVKSTKKGPKRKTVRKSPKRRPKRKTVRKSPKRSPKRSLKRNKYGNLNQIPPNYPNFYTPLELALGQTYEHQLKHYKKIPSTLISTNFQGPASSANGRPNEVPHNFKFTRGSLGRSSLASFENISDPKWITSYPNKFGQYFR